MSKTRKRSTKKTSPRGAKAAKSRPVKKVELRPIREKLTVDVETLGNAIKSAPGTRPDLEEALKRMSRFLADINDICGSNMSLPIS